MEEEGRRWRGERHIPSSEQLITKNGDWRRTGKTGGVWSSSRHGQERRRVKEQSSSSQERRREKEQSSSSRHAQERRREKEQSSSLLYIYYRP